MRRVTAALIVMMFAASPVLAQQPASGHSRTHLGPDTWQVDSGHSSAGFSVKHLVVSTVRGTLGRVSGTVEYDGRSVSSVKADVSIDVKGINTVNEARDKDLRGEGFFDVERYPAITFKSKRAEPAGENSFRLIGDLTIRGVTKEVTLDVEGPSPTIKQGNALKIGASATTKLNRRDFGLDYNRAIEAVAVVGDEVMVTIDIELSKPQA